MGEIRVKSENLFDISSDIHGYINSSGNFVPNNGYTATDYIEIPPNARTLYCSAITKSGQPVYPGLHVAVYDENKTLLTYDMDYNKSKISISVDISLGKYFRADVCSEDYTECMVSFENVPYQPYFLTLPAHEKTADGWKDIPTHTMTANGWQGELTSQSPLEFKATGQSLLDWRIDGRTSGNLFDIGVNNLDYDGQATSSLTVDGSTVYMTVLSGGLTFAYRTKPIITKGLHYIKATTSYSSNLASRIFLKLRSADDTKWLTNSDTSITGWTYNAVYNGWFQVFNDVETSFTIPDICGYWLFGIGFGSNPSIVGTQQSFSNIMLNAGSTALPYEPYGGVGERTENYLPSPSAETKSQSGVTIACDGKGGYTIQREGGYSGAVTLLFDVPETTIPNNSNAKLSIFNSDSAGVSIEFYYNDTRIDYWSLTSSNRVVAIGSFANKTINKVGFNVATTSQFSAITATPQITDITEDLYIPYGYKIPANVRGGNLYSSAWEQGFWAYSDGAALDGDSKYVRTTKMLCKGNTKYEFVCSLPDGSKDYGFVFWDANGNFIGDTHSSDVQNTPVKYSTTSPANARIMAVNIARYSDGERHPADILSFDLYELHETNLYTDAQLMDGDSLDYTTDQTAIPITQGDNTLTVGTQVQPSKVFVKFEG